MFCGSCGKQIPDGSGFCPSCGAAAKGGAPGASASSAGASAGPSAAAAQRAKIEAQLKAGSQDAVQALKVLALDPVGGLPKSVHLFDEGRALIVGAIFGVVYALAMMLAAARGAGMLPGMGMGGMGAGSMTAEQLEALRALGGITPPSTFSIMMKALLAGLVFAAVIIGVYAGARLVFKGVGSLATDVYCAGSSLLPWTVFLIVATLLGGANFEINILVMLFALTYSILMLFTGFSKVANISEGKAALAVPIMLAVSFYLLSVVIRSLA